MIKKIFGIVTLLLGVFLFIGSLSSGDFLFAIIGGIVAYVGYRVIKS